MSSSRFHSLPEQVAESIRQDILKGKWSDTIAGRDTLKKEYEVSGKTIEAALSILQQEGRLKSQGPGKKRLVQFPEDYKPPSKRIAILTYEPLYKTEGYLVEMQHRLIQAGHSAFFTAKSLVELEFDINKVARFVKRNKADAWIVVAANRNILEWFVKQEIPTFALFGRRRGLKLAGSGPEKSESMIELTNHLFSLNHRRIALITRKNRRLPVPGNYESVFLKQLEEQGISTSNYNLPDWEETIDGFHAGLESLFKITPPTALIIDEVHFFLAAQQFCTNKRLRIPEDVSLICTDDDPHLEWFKPSVSHIRWDREPVMRHIMRWAARISHGKDYLRHTFTNAEFVVGGTTGPAPE